MATQTEEQILVGTEEQLRARKCIVVRGSDRPIAVFFDKDNERIYAVDNRCPHMGFPLHRGTCHDGIITCHWHHARFDGHSGCTFDLFADDVEPYDAELRDGKIYVSANPRARDTVKHAHRRLREGMEQNIGLVVAKAILGLRATGVQGATIVRDAALFHSRQRDGFTPGLVILTAAANLLSRVTDQTAFLSLFQGVRRVAADCAGQASRRDRHELETDRIDLETLDRWLGYWTIVRHRDGAERTLLTAVRNGASNRDVSRLLFSAATQRAYADGGHLLDFSNKALELLDHIGWEHAAEVLPILTAQLTSARGGEESNAWRHPIDLVPLMQGLGDQLEALFASAPPGPWEGATDLARQLLGDDPEAILHAIRTAITEGARPAQLGKSLAYAAAMRVARFGTSNEMRDWLTALHTFSYCNATHRMLVRCGEPVLVRSVLQGAMSIYLDRFLNIPPARLPGERERDTASEQNLSSGAPDLLEAFLAALDSRHQVDDAAHVVARYLDSGHAIEPLIDTLVHAVVREDFDFHTMQMVDAAVHQYHQWGPGPEGRTILLAAARYLAAHSPTQRSGQQTATIALRLHRGEKMYEEEEETAGDGEGQT